MQELDVSLKKRKIGEPDIHPGGASSVTADTPKRGESEQGSSAGNENLQAGCMPAVNKLLCDTPSVDLSRDRTALSGKFLEDELKAGREFELRNMWNFDAFELVDELPPGKHAYDMVWVDEWWGDRVRSRFCVRQFKAEGLRDDLFAGTPDTSKYHQVPPSTTKYHQVPPGTKQVPTGTNGYQQIPVGTNKYCEVPTATTTTTTTRTTRTTGTTVTRTTTTNTTTTTTHHYHH